MIVTFRKSFEKDLSKLRDADLLQKIQAAIEEAEAAINLLDINNLKKLKADGKYYRIRVGNYRIGLVLDYPNERFKHWVECRKPGFD